MTKGAQTPINWILLLGLVGVGTAIFFFSLYTASLAGLKRQLGLVGGDINQEVRVNRLYRTLLEVGSVPSCNYRQAVAAIPHYIFAQGAEKVGLGRELARMRVECALAYTLAGNAERGVYTMLKALRYDQAGLLLIEREISKDMANCTLYQTSVAVGYIEAYIESTTGVARGVVEREYAEVQRLNERIIEQCGV